MELAVELIVVLALAALVAARWRGGFTAKRALAGVTAGLLVFVVSSVAGLHHCDSGTPPTWIAIAFGCAFAALVAVSAGHGKAVGLGLGLVVESVLLPMRLAGAYHHAGLTGNRNYADGTYWHTRLTGIRPRRPDRRWIPESTEDCRVNRACIAEGRCIKLDDRCVAVSPEDCARSHGCKSSGQCTLSGEKCIVASEDDCRASAYCKNQGACSARDGKCVATTDADCLASKYCRDQGDCVVYKQMCAASAEGCAKSDGCRDYGLCKASPPRPPLDRPMCGAATDEDCRQARISCQQRGDCRAHDGRCVP